MSRGPILLFAVIVCLAAAAATVLMLSNQRPARKMTQEQELQQRLLGGLGFGPARDLGRCPFAFDPRLAGACSEDCGPIPGGASFCPYHAGTVLDYPPLQRDREPSGDAHLP
jgi:hypothetical protein